jgi:NADH:ubiquinone oxidoreductase subunit F (NADH-binding)/(2Fe-2S) ferredoxin
MGKGLSKSFEETQAEAGRRWQALVGGQVPWIRVGTALCGKAAGADHVIELIHAELQRHNVEAVVSEVGCLGLCYAEPMVDITMTNGSRMFYGPVTPSEVPAIIYSHLVRDGPVADLALGYLGENGLDGVQDLRQHPMMRNQQRIALRNAGNIDPCDIYQYVANGGYGALHKALTRMTPEETLEEVNKSGLRGRGGAAFPTGTKWSFLARSSEPVKYILCNCEEGDPGAFNDKGILESDPHTLLEGMVLAGYVTGANYGYVFIRHGHEGPISRTREAVRQAQELGMLGDNIFGSGFSFNIEVSLTGDSYVSGEETALMEAIEGARAMPRFRPPFPAQVGLFGKPSNINNVKTLAYVPQIIDKGGDWFAGIGQNRSKGTAILCLTGNLAYTGMVEIPLGMTLQQVIYEVAGGVPNGKSLKLLQTGGPLGGVLSAGQLGIALDFEEMSQAGAILGSGGIIAADEDTCAVDMTRALIAFCQFESCGKCFPCRLGMTHILEMLERICRFESEPGDLEMMRQVGQNMQAGSLCGHGQLGFNPVSSALRHFGDEFHEHMVEKRCPTGRCMADRYSPQSTRR